MTYLLDVNALVALGISHHEFHERVASWVATQRSASFATCSITELGFVRVMAQASSYGLTMAQAKTLLVRLKRNDVRPFVFVADDHDITQLPSWVKTAKHTTDGHLVRLADANGMVLATLDEKIPGTYVIPGRRVVIV